MLPRQQTHSTANGIENRAILVDKQLRNFRLPSYRGIPICSYLLRHQALGLKPKTVVKPAAQLGKHDLEELIKGKQDEQEQPDDTGVAAQEVDRVKGLGYIAG